MSTIRRARAAPAISWGAARRCARWTPRERTPTKANPSMPLLRSTTSCAMRTSARSRPASSRTWAFSRKRTGGARIPGRRGHARMRARVKAGAGDGDALPGVQGEPHDRGTRHPLVGSRGSLKGVTARTLRGVSPAVKRRSRRHHRGPYVTRPSFTTRKRTGIRRPPPRASTLEHHQIGAAPDREAVVPRAPAWPRRLDR